MAPGALVGRSAPGYNEGAVGPPLSLFAAVVVISPTGSLLHIPTREGYMYPEGRLSARRGIISMLEL